MKDFDEFIEQLKTTIDNVTDITDFKKLRTITPSEVKYLHLLETIKYEEDSKKALQELIIKEPDVLSVIPILLGKRSSKITVVKEGHEKIYDFSNPDNPSGEYVEFIAMSGLLDAIEESDNLIDLVRGIEIGLDSNARKNRTGKKMEEIVEDYLLKAGLELNKTYFKQMNKSEVEKKFDIDLSAISNDGKTEKRFDFVVYQNKNVYAIEVNFYTTGGSKLNETARSYKNIALEAKNIPGFVFIWVTDGIGWKSATHNLEETWDILDTIYNLEDLSSGVFTRLFTKKD